MTTNPNPSRIGTALRVVLLLLSVAAAGAGFYAVIGAIEAQGRKADDARAAAMQSDEKARAAAKAETAMQLKALADKIDEAKRGEQVRAAEVARALAEVTERHRAAEAAAELWRLAEKKADDQRNLALIKALEACRTELATLAQRYPELAADLNAKQEALAKQVALMRHPPLPHGELQLFELCFESVGHMAKTDHLALFFHWPEPRTAPDKEAQAKVKALFTDTGTELGDVILTQALEDEAPRRHIDKPKEGSKHLSWYLAWRYQKKAKDHKPVAFMSLEFYRDRVRVYWYRGPGRMSVSDDDRAALRLRLLAFAKDLRVTDAGSRSDWGPLQTGGYQDLYFWY